MTTAYALPKCKYPADTAAFVTDPNIILWDEIE